MARVLDILDDCRRVDEIAGGFVDEDLDDLFERPIGRNRMPQRVCRADVFEFIAEIDSDVFPSVVVLKSENLGDVL